MRILAGDVGGTKTWLAMYESEGGAFREARTERYGSADFPGLAPMVALFLGDDRGTVDRAAFGVAGPVVDDVCRATNLPWVIDARALEADLGISRVRLLNDFHAVALGIGMMRGDELAILQEGTIDRTGPSVVLGAGTGLGEAIVVPMPNGTRVLASEGGHCDFAPRDETEIDLLRFLIARHHGRVSYERVLSGPGLVSVYDFVVDRGLAPTTDGVRAARETAEDPGAVIGQAGLADLDDAASMAIDLFVSIYGAEAGNLALKVLPTAGVYVAGGIAPRLIERIRAGHFMKSFLNKGRMSPLLSQMRVAVVMNPKVGLVGARVAAEGLV